MVETGVKAAAGSDGRPEPTLVLVTGASRSGTTMMSRILGKHSKVLSLNELHYFGDVCDPTRLQEPLEVDTLEHAAATLFARQRDNIWRAQIRAADRERARHTVAGLSAPARNAAGVFEACCLEEARAAGKLIACEQTPRNIFCAHHVLAALPGARIIHMVRDPRAVCASQKNRWRLRQLGARNVPTSELVRTWLNYHPITMTKLWVHATERALALRDDPRVEVVAFEQLVAQPEATVSRLSAFLGIEFEPAMLNVPRWGSSNVRHDTASPGISSEVTEQWKDVLDKGELSLVERYAAAHMETFGYDRKADRGLSTRWLSGRHVLTYPFHLMGVALGNPRRALIQLRAVADRASMARNS